MKWILWLLFSLGLGLLFMKFMNWLSRLGEDGSADSNEGSSVNRGSGHSEEFFDDHVGFTRYDD